MAISSQQYQKLLDENKELQIRLARAETTLEAIRNGQVDTLLVSGADSLQIDAAEESGRLYRMMLEAMPEGAAALTMDGLILYANQRLAEMLCSPLEKVQGAWLNQFLSPTDSMRFRHLLEQKTSVNNQLEASLLQPGGGRLPVHLTYGIAHVHDTSTVVLVVSDQTDHHQLEQALRDSEALYRTLVESSEASIAVLDRNGVYLFANRELASNLDRSPDDIVGMSMEDFFPPDAARRQLERVRGVLESQQGRIYESISMVKGQPRLYRTSVQPILGASGRAVLALIHAVDVTEAWQAKEEVAASAARYQHLFENTPVALVELNATALHALADRLGLQSDVQILAYASQQPEFIAQVMQSIQVEDANQAALDLFAARTRQDFFNQWLRLVEPDELIHLVASVYSLIEQQKMLTFETVMLTLAGERKNILARLEYEQRDQDYYVLAAFNDITQRKQAEQSLTRLNRALQMINDCSSAVVRAQDEEQLLSEICRLTVESGGYRLAWVGMVENDPDQSVRPVARSGYDEGYIDAAKISWADNERGRGPTGTAIREGKIQVNHNFATNPLMAPWRAAALERGYQSSITLPLKSEGVAFGAITMYSAVPDAFDQDETGLLAQLADDLSFGVIALRQRQALDRSRAIASRWEHIFEHARWGVVVSSPDGHNLDLMNPEFAAMHGYSMAELTGKPIRDIFAPEERLGLAEHIRQAHETGHHIYESVHLRKDGSTFPVVVDITAVKDENGQVLYRVVNVRDISDRKRMEIALQQANQSLEEKVAERTAELRVSEQRFKLALKNVPVTVAAQDEDLRFIWAYNQRTLDPASVLGKTDTDIFPPETAAVLVPLKRQVLETGEEVRQQLWVESAGRRLFLDLFLEPMRDEAGRITGIGIATVDLTRFKEAEEALRASERRFRLIAEQMPDHLLVQDLDLRYILVINPQLGLTEAEMLGRTDFDFLPPAEAEKLARIKRQVLETGQPVHLVLPVSSLEGEQRVFEGSYFLKSDEQNRIDGLIGYFRDVTEQKRLEESLRQSQVELEQRLKECRAALKKLEQGSKDAAPPS